MKLLKYLPHICHNRLLMYELIVERQMKRLAVFFRLNEHRGSLQRTTKSLEAAERARQRTVISY